MSTGRPYWRAQNPRDKRWFCLYLARTWRDERLQRIRRMLTRWDTRLWGRPVEHRLQRELRRLQELQNAGRVDEFCFPAWAARRWRVEGRDVPDGSD